jgi:chloramphenicol O-acetyltransferase type A
MKYKKIDLQQWKRKDQYDFFKTFDLPFFNVVANVDVTELYTYSKQEKLPFFYTTLHCLLQTINAIPEFKCRIDKQEVIEYEEVHAGVTILKEDNTFLYGTIMYNKDLLQFVKEGKASVEEQKRTRGFLPHGHTDLIYVSALPWVSFTGFQHAKKTDHPDSIPRVVLGKYFEENERLKMPVSFEAHHALADGYHAGLFFQYFQQFIDKV